MHNINNSVTFFKRYQIRLSVLVALTICMSLSAVFGDDAGRARFGWNPVVSPLVSGYKVHWGLASGIYTNTVDAGNATQLIIPGFAQGTQYFAAVTAYSSSGDESDYSTEISFVYDSADRVILLEAENGALSAPMQVMQDSATTWVAAPAVNPAAADKLSFNVPYCADYYVWCRVQAPSASMDSFYVTVDQQTEEIYYVYGESSPPASAFKSGWTWSRIQVSPGTPCAYTLAGGAHTIQFRCRDNTPLDRVVIVNDPDFTPTDALPRSGDFVAVTCQPQGGSVSVGGGLTLAATLIATSPPSLQWYHDGVAVPVSNDTSLSLANAQASTGGAYILSASVNGMTANSQSAIVTVLSATGSATTFQVRSVAVAKTGQVTFTVDGASASPIGVMASSDLVHWTLVDTQAVSNNTLTVVDPGAVGSTKRFYRLADSGGQ